jgi:hypothetical protein
VGYFVASFLSSLAPFLHETTHNKKAANKKQVFFMSLKLQVFIVKIVYHPEAEISSKFHFRMRRAQIKITTSPLHLITTSPNQAQAFHESDYGYEKNT